MLREERAKLVPVWSAVLLAVMVAASLAACGATPAPTAPPTVAVQPTAAPEQPVRGGSVSIAFTDNPEPNFDSILGYNSNAWEGLVMLYRGLMIYEGDKAVPDMASGYKISADGTVYTFTLRPGIKFHNGREVEAADFKYSLERCLDPEWASWANYYLVSIEGAQDVIDGNTKDCTGIQVVDKSTLRFKLVAPDMTFLNILALPNNWVVPKEEVDKWGQDFGQHPVGTGPFMLTEYTPDDKAVFVRNPNFFHEGQPYVDQVTFYFGVDPSAALLRLQKGEVDILFGDTIPVADFSRLVNDPQYKDWFFREPSMYTWWIGVNNTVAPLDNKLLRQALNLAVDKERIALLTGGKGVALWAIYPSTAPGYDPNYKPYVYDQAAAKAKLTEAGLSGGVTLELLIVSSDPLEVTMAQSIQQDLGQIGIQVDIKQVDGNVFQEMMSAGNTQLFLNSWYMIQPDPADLVNNLYMTGAGSNYDFYSNPQVDALATEALAEQNRDKRLQLYGQIQQLLMDDAVHVPLINGLSFYMYNPRLGGFFSRSEYGPFMERLWVKP